MIVLVHDKGTNNFYAFEAGARALKGLEHGDVDAMVYIKKLLSELKPLVLSEKFPTVRFYKLYQIDTSTISAEVPVDFSRDPEAWEIPSVIPRGR